MLAPTLNALNLYQANALTVEHRHQSGTTIDVTLSKTAGDARFVLVGTTATLSPGGAHTVQVKDEGLLPLGTYTITVRAEGNVLSGGASVGKVVWSRDVAVTVS